MRSAFRSAVVLAMLVAAIGWGLRLRPGHSPFDVGRDLPDEPARQRGTATPQAPEPAEQPPARPGAQAAASARSAEVPFYGFCPEDAPTDAAQARPTLGAHLTIGQHEMIDRARAMRRERSASDELRQGLRSFFAGDEARALAALAAAPDRSRDGFDFAATAAHAFGIKHLNRGNHRGALRLAREALSLAPEHLPAHVLAALAHRRMGEASSYRRALARARALDPDDPALALALGRALAHTPRLGEAIESLDVFLRSYPGDVAIAQLRARLTTQQDLHRGLSRAERGGVQLLWPRGPMDADLATTTLQAITEALRDAARLTGMNPRPELFAVIYREHTELLAATCVPTWTQGIFDGTLRLHVDSLKRTRERNRVVRHEVLHAQVRSGGFDAPQWFHEGLAQHFADEHSRAQRRSYQLMVDNRTYVPFPSLEGSFLVISQGRDARLAYHQSLAMIELLVARRGEGAIRAGIDFLREGGEATLLWDHMAGPSGLDGDDLLAFVAEAVAEH